MYDGIKLFLEWVGYFFIAYLIGYSTFLFLSVVVGSLELYKHRRQEMFKSILPSDYYLPISIIVPAYNEEVTVADTVRSLLALDYRSYEIIVVDDGSKDRTSEVLAETFDMHLVHRPIRRQINCQREEYVYETRAQKVPVTLIRKKNGGKADALNMGINAANFPYFICMDADSVLQYDSLRRIAQPVRGNCLGGQRIGLSRLRLRRRQRAGCIALHQPRNRNGELRAGEAGVERESLIHPANHGRIISREQRNIPG